jgi:type VI protein secretion system component Hcp
MGSNKTEGQPKRGRRHLLKAVAGATVLSVAGLVAGVAFASVPDSGGVIHGCMVTSPVLFGPAKGTVRIIDAATDKCQGNETAIQWSQTGPAGADGAAGPTGLQGPQGPQGSQGPAGKDAPNPAPNSVVVGTASIPGVTGSNPDGSVNILSYSQGISNTAPAGGVGGGGGAGKAILTPFTFTKESDQASPQLVKLAFLGQHILNVIVTIQAPGSKTSTQFNLQDVQVTGDQLAQTGAAGAVQTEQVGLIFSRITMTSGGNSTCLNLATNTAC